MPRISNYYLIKRLHSLAGLFPLGFFLVWHLYSQSISLSMDGVSFFNQFIEEQREIPFGVLIEIIFIYFPLIFHAGLGLVLFADTKNNITTYPQIRNLRFFLQRITGFIAIIFISYHIYEARIEPALLGISVDYSWMVKMFEHPVKLWIYLIGILAIGFHLSSGIWSALISWGITTSQSSQKLSFYFCSLLFVSLSITGILIILNYTYHYQEAPYLVMKILNLVKLYLFK